MIPICGLPPLTLLTEVPTVVSNNGHYSVLVDTVLSQSIEHEPKAMIHKAASRIVGSPELSRLALRKPGFIVSVIKIIPDAVV